MPTIIYERQNSSTKDSFDKYISRPIPYIIIGKDVYWCPEKIEEIEKDNLYKFTSIIDGINNIANWKKINFKIGAKVTTIVIPNFIICNGDWYVDKLEYVEKQDWALWQVTIKKH